MSTAELLSDSPKDDTWEQRVLGLTPAERRALLRRADELRNGTPEEVRVAYACYSALRDHLDPTREEDAARMTVLLARMSGPDPAMLPVARRAVETPTGTDLWVQGQLRLGILEREAGRAAESYRRLRLVYRHCRKNGHGAERAAAVNLALICLQDDREVEAMVIARRALNTMREAGDTHGIFFAHMLLLSLCIEVRDWNRFDELAEQVSTLLQALPEGVRRLRESEFLCNLARAARDRGDFDAADALCDRAEALDASLPWLLAFRALLRAAQGRHEEARALVEEARNHPATPVWLGPEIGQAAVRCSLALDPHEIARRAVDEFLDAREREWREGGSPGNLARLARDVGGELRNHPSLLNQARRAFDLAAAGCVARIGEIIRFSREEEGEVHREDRALLSSLSASWRTLHREVLAGISTLLSKPPAAGAAADGFGLGDVGPVAMCAWCTRVRTGPGEWLPIGQYLVELDGQLLTHGICPDCREDARVG